jgi:hypothetical protein
MSECDRILHIARDCTSGDSLIRPQGERQTAPTWRANDSEPAAVTLGEEKEQGGTLGVVGRPGISLHYCDEIRRTNRVRFASNVRPMDCRATGTTLVVRSWRSGMAKAILMLSSQCQK